MDLELSDTHQNTVDKLSENFSDSFLEVYQSTGDTFILVEAENIVEICQYLKNELHYIYLNDIFGIDRFTSEDRFEVVYNLISLRDRDKLFVKVRLPEESPELDSITDIWKSASWMEREVYDMFGVKFNNHPDFRRIFMPEDYEYFPMRKEFPLLGIPGSIELPNTTPDTE